MRTVAAANSCVDRIFVQRFSKPCAKMRSTRQFTTATACKIRASQTPCEHQFSVFAWCSRRAHFANRCGGE
eukprot:4142954-Lingulodinium_polyedra.AAC.1